MTKRTCTVPGCQRPHEAHGLCRLHYQRQWRSPRRCTVPGCERPHSAHGFCRRHVQRWRRGGDPFADPRPAWQHGHASRRTKRSREYRAWEAMKARCANPNHNRWHLYGGRGITVWPGWLDDFPAFLAHIGPHPGPGYSIDRIDNDRGYEPGNVRWATAAQQARNQRPRRAATHCRAGHPYDDANTRVGPDGKRYCRACARARERRRPPRRHRRR